VDGRYRVQGELGAGGRGEVHRVLDEQTGEVVALKLLRTDRLGDQSLAGLADGEARTGWYLNRRGILHPNIVRTLQIGRWRPPGGDRELPYLVMEHVAGPTLGEWMKGYGDRLPEPARVFELVEQIAAGLAEAHDAGLLHRDLKPSNVLIDHATGTPKITDFGISIAVAGSDPTQARGREFATPAWAAPEQLDSESRSAEGLHTDVYSLGKILYYLLSGRLYDPQLYSPVGGSRRLPRQIDDLIRRACAQNPEDRFADVPAFLAAFRAVVRRYSGRRRAGSGKPQADRPRRFLKVTAVYTLLGAPFFLAILLGTRVLAMEELAFRVRSDDVLTLPLLALGVAWLVCLPLVAALSR
ncbi:MAG: serine/threonine protein kinase, partial [bacterium]|nr:serine/threonine protein kinase [bacterium]